jgi:hypothetical protein
MVRDMVHVLMTRLFLEQDKNTHYFVSCTSVTYSYNKVILIANILIARIYFRWIEEDKVRSAETAINVCQRAILQFKDVICRITEYRPLRISGRKRVFT